MKRKSDRLRLVIGWAMCASCEKVESDFFVAFYGITICEGCIREALHLIDPYPDE